MALPDAASFGTEAAGEFFAAVCTPIEEQYRLVPGARTFEQLADGKEVHIDNAGFFESRFGNVARGAGESKA